MEGVWWPLPLKVNIKKRRYFDSGSFRHMIGNKDLLIDLRPCNLKFVTFGEGVMGVVLGSGIPKASCMPKLENVLLVEGLKANLISISQLRYHNLFVKFIKNKCLVVDSSNTCVIEEERSSYNFYLLTCL